MENGNMSLPVPQIEEKSAMPEQELLPSKLLQQQVCSECHQYLTVLPIVINCDGDVICGRHEADGIHSMLNKVIENYRFQCVNHYEGCRELLNSVTSLQHEQQCTDPKSVCLFCPFSSNWSKLLQHSLLNHPFNTNKNAPIQFVLEKRFSQKYIYNIENSIYKVTIVIKSKKIFLSIQNLIQKDSITEKLLVNFSFAGELVINKCIILTGGLEELVTENLDDLPIDCSAYCQLLINQVELTLIEIDVCRKLTSINQELYKKYTSLNGQSTSLYQSQREKLDVALEEINLLNCTIIEKDETIKRVFNLTKYGFMILKCSACKMKIIDSIFVCPNNHFLCEKCLHTVNIRFCSSCANRCEFTKVANLSEIRKSCDWIGCDIATSLTEYIEHKKTCPERTYICPDVDCAQKFPLSGLKTHWHFLTLEQTTNNVFSDILSTKEFFLLHDTELYHVTIRAEDGNELVIKEIDVIDDEKTRLNLTSGDDYLELKLDPGSCLNGKSVFMFTNDDIEKYKEYIVYFDN